MWKSQSTRSEDLRGLVCAHVPPVRLPSPPEEHAWDSPLDPGGGLETHGEELPQLPNPEAQLPKSAYNTSCS